MKGKLQAMTDYSFAKSLKGHDKGKVYKVLEAGKEKVLLEDVNTQKRKTKNRKHIQPIKGDLNV